MVLRLPKNTGISYFESASTLILPCFISLSTYKTTEPRLTAATLVVIVPIPFETARIQREKGGALCTRYRCSATTLLYCTDSHPFSGSACRHIKPPDPQGPKDAIAVVWSTSLLRFCRTRRKGVNRTIPKLGIIRFLLSNVKTKFGSELISPSS